MYVRAGVAKGVTEDSEAYSTANVLIVIYCLLFALFGIVEFLIMFSGATLFNNQINLVQVAFHVAC